MPTVNFNIHLPGYEVLAELGRGNSRVLKARHLPTGDVVAIKQYAFAADTDTLRRFERESQIMTQIDHPNIVRVWEVQLDAPMPYVVMDFVEGGDLRSLLRQEGQLSIPMTIRLGLQLTGAFRAIHPLHVIHRDIKPENILYRRLASGELHFLLTDFGIAKLRADDSARTRTGQSLMTYEYAAPEQFDNPRQVDEAADYYALGVVLYECLTGKVPFVLQNETGLARFMQQVLTAPIPTPALPSGQALPLSLTTLLTSLLVRDPPDRLHNIDQLELLLEQSQVEYLKANRSVQTPPMNPPRTVAGPVVTAKYIAETTTGLNDRLPAEPASNWTRWAITGVVLAGLAFGLYTHQPRQRSDDDPDSGATLNSESRGRTTNNMDPDTESVTTVPTTPEPEEVNISENQVSTEPAYQTPVDSTENSRSMTDSVSVSPPDTAQ